MSAEIDLKTDPDALMLVMRRAHELAVEDFTNHGNVNPNRLRGAEVLRHCRVVDYQPYHERFAAAVYSTTIKTFDHAK